MRARGIPLAPKVLEGIAEIARDLGLPDLKIEP